MWSRDQPKFKSKLQTTEWQQRAAGGFVSLWLWCCFFIPVLQSLFEDVFRIFREIAQLLGTQVTETLIYEHPTGTIYQSRWVSHLLQIPKMPLALINQFEMHQCSWEQNNCISLATKLLTSIMQCWARRRGVGTSNSHHSQHCSLSLEGTTISSLRSVCVVIVPGRGHVLPSITSNATINTKCLFSLSRQMTTFSQNPHPSDNNISGTVCSLLISDGNREIKLKHLREMIEVQPVCCELS